jgi:ABC-2 type transport system ATP-binding protein
MLQVGSLPETLTVGEHLHLFSSYYPAPLAPAEVVAAAGLAGLEDRPFGKLSGGQQRRLLFALAVCGDPDLLLLDEPTVGLDVEARRGLWEQIRRLVARGRSLLLTTHYLEEADALADRVVVLHQGRIVADGSPAEIKIRVALKRVRCTTGLSPEEVAAMPEVGRLRRDGATLEILTRRPEALLAEMLARDPELGDLEVAGAGLEEAFLALTGKGDQTLAEAVTEEGGAP